MQQVALDECFDLSFTEEPASYFYLILELYPTEARAMWYHTTKKLVTGFASYAFDGSLSNLLQQNKRLALEYKEVLLSIRSSNYLIYPNILGNTIDEEAFKLTNDLEEHERLQQYPLVNLKAHVIYPIADVLDKECHHILNHFKLIPHIVPALEMEVNQLKQTEIQNAVWMHTYTDHLDLRVYQDGKLKLANSFFQSSKEDIAYYVLYAAEILKINTKGTPLHVGGSTVKGDETSQLLGEYWKQIAPSKQLDNIEFSSSLPEDKRTPFHHLTYSLLCAS